MILTTRTLINRILLFSKREKGGSSCT